jgi:hypothetical protein
VASALYLLTTDSGSEHWCQDKPDYFVSMTCNTYWEEVGRELFSGQISQDCPKLVARVYRSKLYNLHDHLIKKKYFGEVLAYAQVTEFKKCGLPH